jgi:hypothetical protein
LTNKPYLSGAEISVANQAAGLALGCGKLHLSRFFEKVERGIGKEPDQHVIATILIILKPPYHFFTGNAKAPE